MKVAVVASLIPTFALFFLSKSRACFKYFYLPPLVIIISAQLTPGLTFVEYKYAGWAGLTTLLSSNLSRRRVCQHANI